MTNFDDIRTYLASLGVEDRCPLAEMLAATDARAFPACDAAAVLDATCAARACEHDASLAGKDLSDPCEHRSYGLARGNTSPFPKAHRR